MRPFSIPSPRGFGRGVDEAPGNSVGATGHRGVWRLLTATALFVAMALTVTACIALPFLCIRRRGAIDR